MLNIEQVKKLREETGVSVTECKKALTESNGNIEQAKAVLKNRSRELATKKKDRATSQGIIESYIHTNQKLGVLLELDCETDFVAKAADFKNLAHELCLQIAADINEEIPLLDQPWIKDESKTIKELIDEYIVKVGENIIVKRFIRYEL